MVRPTRFERVTPSFGGTYSIQLSYGRFVADLRAYDTALQVVILYQIFVKGLFVRKVTLFLLGCLFVSTLWAQAYKIIDGSEKAIEERLTPPGAGFVDIDQSAPVPTISAADAANMPPGQKTYETFCVVCHGAGVAGAPKKGDLPAWKKRLDEGWAVVLARAMKGYNAMPAKGTCATCSEADLKAAIEFMSH